MSKKKPRFPRKREIRLSDGRTYTLAPVDLNVAIELEASFDGWPNFVEAFGGFKGLRKLLYILLRNAGYEFSEEEVGAKVSIGDASRIRSALDELFAEDLGLDDLDQEKKPSPQ